MTSEGSARGALTANDLFVSAGGKLTFLAQLSIAAYDDSLDLPAGLRAVAIPEIADGYFSDPLGVAAALVGRSADALFVAFRGTDDTADLSEWLRATDHYARFEPLIALLTDYLAGASDIRHVYLTGHSLGAAMAQGLMQVWAGDAYEAVTFASLGFGLGAADQDDPRIVNIRLAGDPVSVVAGLSGVRGDQYIVTDLDGAPGEFDLLDRHSLYTYAAIVGHLDGNGAFPSAALAGNGRVDAPVEVPLRIAKLTAEIDDASDVSVRAHGDLTLADLFGGSGYGMALISDGLVFVGRPFNRLADRPTDDSVVGGAGADSFFGGDGRDSLLGMAGDDLVAGGNGDDRILGDDGDDWHLNGNVGDDVVVAGAGHDRIHGGRGDDDISGEDGDDVLSGDLGDDLVTGGSGRDIFAFAGSSGHDVIVDFSVVEVDRISIASNVNGGGLFIPADVLSRITASPSGDAVIDLGAGNTITLRGVAPASLLSEQFWIV